MKTYIYVDGFNLYYNSVKNTSYKWLDIDRLCNLLLTNNQVIGIKYFAARIKSRPDDPHKNVRQQAYLRALKTIPYLKIYFGTFSKHTVSMPLATPPNRGSRMVDVIKTEEKGSDVNIATQMLLDAFGGRYEAAVLITNDSDLYPPIKAVQSELGLTVGILNPEKNEKKWSRKLRKTVDFMKPIRAGALCSCQFPDVLTDRKGEFHKPPEW